MLVIVDFDLGNPGSIKNMFRRQQIEATISRDEAVLQEATRLVLPGVGAFDHGMKQIERLGLRQVLDHKAQDERVPVLGLCLGAQLMTRGSEEGTEAGLGWVDAETVHLRTGHEATCARTRFPHVGWNFVYPAQKHPLLEGVPEPLRYYFVHTFKLRCEEPEDVLTRTRYEEIVFTSAFARGNLVGAQFHPEKSHRYGKALLENFARWSPDTPSHGGPTGGAP